MLKLHMENILSSNDEEAYKQWVGLEGGIKVWHRI